MGNTAQEKVNSYLGRLRVHLRGLRPENVQEILDELCSHITEKASSNGEMTPAAVETALSALGSPEELAYQYVTDEVVATGISLLSNLNLPTSLKMSDRLTGQEKAS